VTASRRTTKETTGRSRRKTAATDVEEAEELLLETTHDDNLDIEAGSRSCSLSPVYSARGPHGLGGRFL
jgi:hypothetical protein